MAKTFIDNPEKRVVRERWNTPLLRYLNAQHSVRYRYLGLPGTDLIDVKLWKDMIDEVIAFEPPDRDNPLTGRTAYNELTYNLRKERIPGRAYCGSFEEVVLLRKDYEGQSYVQDKVVTLYNLDFCNEIGSKVRTIEGEKLWRFEAIRQVLLDQRDCYKRNGGPRHFVLMITARNQIGAGQIRTYLTPSRLQGDARAFYKECSEITPIPEDRRTRLIGSHSWVLKVLLHNMLCSYFGSPNFSALFFPQVCYRGTRARDEDGGFIDSPMLHWLVLCRFEDVAAPMPGFWPSEYLSKASVKVQMAHGKGRLEWGVQAGEAVSASGTPNPVDWLSQYGANILDGIDS